MREREREKKETRACAPLLLLTIPRVFAASESERARLSACAMFHSARRQAAMLWHDSAQFSGLVSLVLSCYAAVSFLQVYARVRRFEL